MGSGKRRTAIPIIAVVVAVMGAVVLTPLPALAHGGTDEADAVDLVEQALAIVVNSPDAAGEALERIEAALAEEAGEPTGELDVASLELAVGALETGDLHGAEDALVAALGIDPHAQVDERVEAVEESPSGSTADPAAAPTEAPAREIEDSDSEERPAETAGASIDTAFHGLTDRVDGGFRTPSGTDIAALLLAGVLAVGGFALTYSRTGGK